MILDVIIGFEQVLLLGLIWNITPSTGFIFELIPQFIDLSNGPTWAQILILGVIFLLNGFLFVRCLGVALGYFANTFRVHVGLLNKLTAILCGGLAARLIID